MAASQLASYPDFYDHGEGFTLRSPAKVNLLLRVIGRRPDGYHELETVFQELDWYDELEFRPGAGFDLTVEGADLPQDQSNLVFRAAERLAEAAGVACGGRIRLVKRLPVQGGVGGGSSNGSTALLGLNRLWGLEWPVERLVPIAQSLGADCPFFLYGGLARGSGRGDVISPMTGSATGWYVLLVPPFGVETAEVFRDFSVRLTEVERNVIFRPLRVGDEAEVHPAFSPCNDLENIVFQRYPVLRDLRDRVLEAGAEVALLSGSGSTVFGIFESEVMAEDAALGLSMDSSVRVKVCRAVARPRK